MTRDQVIGFAIMAAGGKPITKMTADEIVHFLEMFASMVSAEERDECIENVRTVGGSLSIECEDLIRARGGN